MQSKLISRNNKKKEIIYEIMHMEKVVAKVTSTGKAEILEEENNNLFTQEEVDSAKKLGQWLQDNGYTSDGEKLTKEIMETVEEIAKETIELLDEAEEILNENNIDIERDDMNE